SATSSSSRPAPASAPMDVDEHNVPPAKRPRYTREYHQQQVRNMDSKQRKDYDRLHNLCKYCFSPDHFIAACPERPCTLTYGEPNRTPSPLPHESEVIEVYESSEERYSSTENSEESRYGPCLAPGYKNTLSPPRHAVSPDPGTPRPTAAPEPAPPSSPRLSADRSVVPSRHSANTAVKYARGSMTASYVTALLDSGATHDLMSKVLLAKFKLPHGHLEESLWPRLADGEPPATGGIEFKTDPVKFTTGNLTCEIPFYIIGLGNYHVILGMSFL
ncbi:hypothetical protein RI367_008841, partial [Sorochytrium milnesiophthora]